MDTETFIWTFVTIAVVAWCFYRHGVESERTRCYGHVKDAEAHAWALDHTDIAALADRIKGGAE